jgi:hypothetical protein
MKQEEEEKKKEVIKSARRVTLLSLCHVYSNPIFAYLEHQPTPHTCTSRSPATARASDRCIMLCTPFVVVVVVAARRRVFCAAFSVRLSVRSFSEVVPV